MKKYFSPIFVVCLQFIFIHLDAQTGMDLYWEGCVRNESGGAGLSHATIASFSYVVMYSTDEKGCFRVRLPLHDSIRVASLGFEPRTFVLSEQIPDSTGRMILPLTQISYQLKEVTIMHYTGIFDPLIFPKHIDEADKIHLNLPAHFGSQISKLPPDERPLMERSPVAAVASPVSFVYSVFSRRERSLKSLAEAKTNAMKWNHREAVAGRDVIQMISGFEGDMLEKFMIYCNIHLRIHASDTGASAINKITSLFEQFKEEQKMVSEENQLD
jgi:hypothetical protein